MREVFIWRAFGETKGELPTVQSDDEQTCSQGKLLSRRLMGGEILKKVSSYSLWQEGVRREVTDVMQAVDKLVNLHRLNMLQRDCASGLCE